VPIDTLEKARLPVWEKPLSKLSFGKTAME